MGSGGSTPRSGKCARVDVTLLVYHLQVSGENLVEPNHRSEAPNETATAREFLHGSRIFARYRLFAGAGVLDIDALRNHRPFKRR